MRKWFVRSVGLLTCAVLLFLLLFQGLFDIPEQPQLLLPSEKTSSEVKQCYQNENAKPIDNRGSISLLVWNIYKENNAEWQGELEKYSQQRQLILLQEVSLTDDFTAWLSSKPWGSQYVNAFEVFDTSAGVLNLAPQMPSKACAYIQLEPWLRLPKSALYARYRLSNGEYLAVINIHAINFTFGVSDYKQQIDTLRQVVQQHTGPLILAGDFNTWSESRMASLKEVTQSLQLQEVAFNPDNRKRFVTGLPLDHVFVANLEVIKAEAPVTDASDHNPLLIELRISGYTEPKG